jgi:hypothetical protein
VAGVGDGLGLDPRVVLYRALQDDVVEADDEDSVEGTRRFEQCSHSVDGEVRPLGLLDLDKDPHLLALRPVHGLREGRNACSRKSSVEAGPGIKAADLFQTEVRGEAVAIRGAVDRS